MYRKLLLILLLSATLTVDIAHAQLESQESKAAFAEAFVPAPKLVADGPSVRRLWVSAGLGVGALNSGGADTYYAGQVSAHWQRGRQILSLRGAGVAGICIFENDCNKADIGLLVGVGTTGSAGHASVGAGIALVPGTEDFFSTVGLPLQAQFLFDVGGVVGLGLYAFLDINPEQTFGGITLSLSAGDLQ